MSPERRPETLVPPLRRAGFTRYGTPNSTIFTWLRNSDQGYKFGLFGKLVVGTGGALHCQGVVTPGPHLYT